MTFSERLKDRAGWISLCALVVSIVGAAFSGCTLYFNFIAPADVSAAVGEIVLLNQKPFIGLNVALRNSGARQATITRGKLVFDKTELNLVMQAIEPDLWTYQDPPQQLNAKFSFFTPIILGKDEIASAPIWFEADTGGARIFTDATHAMILHLYDGYADEPIVTKEFSIRLTADNVSAIYAPNNLLTSLPVHVSP